MSERKFEYKLHPLHLYGEHKTAVQNLKINEYLAEFVGALFGDGRVTHNKKEGYAIKIWCNYFDEEQYANHISSLINIIFGVKSFLKKDKNTIMVSFHSKEISEKLLELGVPTSHKGDMNIPAWIKNNHNLRKAFLRGLFDTDGGFIYKRNDKNKNYIYLNTKISMKSFKFAKKIQEFLLELGFRANVNKKIDKSNHVGYDVVLNGINECEKWINVIKSNNQKNVDKYNEFKDKVGVRGFEPRSSANFVQT